MKIYSVYLLHFFRTRYVDIAAQELSNMINDVPSEIPVFVILVKKFTV